MDEEKYHFGREIPKSIAIVAMGASRIDFGSNAAHKGSYRAVADEIWVVNRMAGVVLNDIVFRMDDLRHDEDMPEPFRKVLIDHPLVVTSTAYPEFPGSVEYPLEEVLNCVEMPYLNTTPSYALAYAMYLGVKTIHIYGCDYTYPNAAMAEEGRGCFEWLMGLAFKSGTELMIGPNSSLLDTCIPINRRFYGYKEPPNIIHNNGRWEVVKNA